jgi:hypothetical protein
VLYGLGYFSATELLELISSFITERTILIGFSTTFLISYSPRAATLERLHTGNRYIADLEFILNSIKVLHPKIRIVLGGPSARNILTDLSNVDFLVEGHADNWIVDYVQALKRKSWAPETLIHKNVPLILNPKNEAFNFRSSKITFTMEDGMIPGETLPLEVSRGCIFNCKFCSYPLRNKSINDPILWMSWEFIHPICIRNHLLVLQTKVPYSFCLSINPTSLGLAHPLSGVPISPTLCSSPARVLVKFSKQTGQTCSAFRSSS